MSLDPVVVLTTTIVVSTILLIGAAVLGIDKGVLAGMSKPEYARGLITYLFAVVTIGSAIVLVLSSLTGAGTGEGEEQLQQAEKQFQQAKEVLSLLLGVFGTIVGYYFGAEAGSKSDKGGAGLLRVSPIDVSPKSVERGAKVSVRAFVDGGSAPYRFALMLGAVSTEPKELVAENGWIVRELTIDTAGSPKVDTLKLLVQDANGARGERIANIEIL